MKVGRKEDEGRKVQVGRRVKVERKEGEGRKVKVERWR